MRKPSLAIKGPFLFPLLLVALGCTGVCRAETLPALWGYGAKSCAEFLNVAPSEGTPEVLADSEYLRYREWLAGFVTGLNLATGRDVLQGAELDAALVRIRANCEERPADDLFNASAKFIQSLAQTPRQ